MASAGLKNTTAALLLLLLPLLLSSTVSEARHKIDWNWHGPIIYASPPPPHPGHHGGLDLPYITEQAPAASPEDPAGDLSWVPRKP
ncbi:unnamed protein product [Miscanthus lutarioriparius]|uniref:Uncharacterized protein n=1 Tax=Miscanthus lutarioriparius TaxID=422564 RepID=A0A811PY02_9POAL|nr:unnamed protein product [Miscanthus lutarioriparius]